jgi:GntR family transcriptional regulator
VPDIARQALDPTSHVPLYLQLAGQLRAQIGSGHLKPRDQLPSETELVHLLGISRATAIAALSELVRTNEAFRVRGRGTFVANPVIGTFSLASSFTEDTRQRGLSPTSVTISFAHAVADKETAHRLDMPSDGAYFRLARLRLVEDDPVAVQTAYLPTGLYPGLERKDFETTHLYALMRDKYGLVPHWTEAIIEARTVDASDADRLQVPRRSPVLVVWHLTLDASLGALEYVRSVYRSDRFSFATGRQPISPQAVHPGSPTS